MRIFGDQSAVSDRMQVAARVFFPEFKARRVELVECASSHGFRRRNPDESMAGAELVRTSDRGVTQKLEKRAANSELSRPAMAKITPYQS